VALVGAGDQGHAIARYPGFAERGFRIVRVFDNDPEKIGMRIGNHTVHSSEEMIEIIRSDGIKIALLTVPSKAAQTVAEQLVQAGVKAILNYTPVLLNLPDGVRVETVSPILQLQHMMYYL
jgi:redox-sensing transcriptional repressor